MTTNNEIEKRLEDLGADLASDDSIAETVMARLDNAKIEKPNKHLFIRILTMKDKITKLAAAAVIVVGIFIFFSNGQKTLYAQALQAFETARTIHVVIAEYRDGNWFNDHEIWYDDEEGIREEYRFEEQTKVRIDNKQYEWRHKVGDQLVAQINSYRAPDEWARELYDWLRFNPERLPAEDKVIGDVPCEMYILSDGGGKISIWVDEENRVLEFEQERNWQGQEIRSVATIEYDIDIDKNLFLPKFDANVEIVGPRELIEEKFPLETAIFKRKSLGLVFAVHELEFGSDLKYLVCSNRLAEQTRDEISNGHPWTYYGQFDLFGRYDESGMYLETSDKPILLARMQHDGIQIDWYVLIPSSSKAKQISSCDVDVRVNTANQLEEKLKAEGLPIREKFRLNIILGETEEQLVSLSEIASHIFLLGKKFDPIVHSFALTKIVTEPDGNKVQAWKKPGIELSEEEYIKDCKDRVEYYLNRD